MSGITVQEQYDSADIVVIAQAVSVEKSGETAKPSNGIRSTTMVVENVFKGSIRVGEQMVFAQGTGADCIWVFGDKSIGQRYLFYLAASENRGPWIASICGRSRQLEGAADDLLYLENIARVRGKTRLSGTLILYEPSVLAYQEPTRRNLGGKKVRVIGEKKSYELITNQDGVYEIYDLPPGRYQVVPEIPNDLKIESSSASVLPPSAFTLPDQQTDEDRSEKYFYIVIEAGKHAYRDFRYCVNNRIRGRVLNSVGVAMNGVCVTLLPVQGNGFRRLDCTDDERNFEITGIPSGRYVIAANYGGLISSNEPFRTVYYPNTFDREKGAVINVDAGHTVRKSTFWFRRQNRSRQSKAWSSLRMGNRLPASRLSSKLMRRSMI